MGNTLRRWWNAWREGLSWLPLLLVALLCYGAINEFDWRILLWREAYVALIPLAILGALCARSLNRAAFNTPLRPIRSARPGYVALHGQAQPILDHPLTAPDTGRPCVWYHHSYHSDHHFVSHESRRPFRLLDETGEVLVMPADAEVVYGGEGAERRIEAGDTLYILGELRPSIETPLSFVEPDKQFGRVIIKHEKDSESDPQALKRKANAWFEDRAKPITLPRLPSIILPRDGRPYLISVEDQRETTCRYRFLMQLNAFIAMIGGLLFPFTEFWLLYQ